jgi:flavin reductase (DIM6/NTAB) family NADH-FMN oxidoreductase RutF
VGVKVEAADVDRFRRVLGSFAVGVNVITFRTSDGKPHGMTATAMCSVSVDPLLVLICVNRSTRTHDEILTRGRFGVSILGLGGHTISRQCARPGADKSLDSSWLSSDSDCETPVLRDAIAHLDCTVHDAYTAGTHSVILGRVEAAGAANHGEPLIHYRGSYRMLADSEVVAGSES